MLGREMLKWLMALGVGAATAALAWLTGHLGTGPTGVDALISTVAVGVLTRVVGWLTSKVPAPTA
jgi:hypothetical protein